MQLFSVLNVVYVEIRGNLKNIYILLEPQKCDVQARKRKILKSNILQVKTGTARNRITHFAFTYRRKFLKYYAASTSTVTSTRASTTCTNTK